MGDTTGLIEVLAELRRTAGRLGRSGVGDGPTDREAILGLADDLERAVAAVEAEARLGRIAADLAGLFAAHSMPKAFAQAALAAIAQAMNGDRGFVLLFGEDASEASVLAEHPAAADSTPGREGEARGPSRSFLAELVEKRATILVVDAQDTPYHHETSVVALHLRSVLATPLLFDGRLGGAIYLESSTLADAFRDEDRVLIEAVARLLAPYLQAGRRLDAAVEDRARLSAALEGRSHYRDIVGTSPAIRAVVAMIERLKDSDAPVLLEGESGTGKELVARALHFTGRRASGSLVAINCAAIPETLIESELFGHERGAFTGATERQRGRLEQAHRGTLFLDEVAELRYEVQAKLLRVLQDQTFERLGGTEPVRVDVRVIAATNTDLRQRVRDGRFREDLFYRLEVVPLKVPSLRERREDIPLLVRHFLAESARATGREVAFEPEVLTAIQDYPFPGNVRELKNLVSRLVALTDGPRVGLQELPAYVTGERTVPVDKDPFRRFLRHAPESNEDLKAARAAMQDLFDRYVRKLEGKFCEALLERTGGNIAQAAKTAGMNRTLFHRKLKEAREELP